MPDISKLNIDPAALIALGFLGAIIVLSIALFAWLTSHTGEPAKRSD